MALPFLSETQAKRLDSSVVIDLGARTSKAVYMQRRGDRFQLLNFSLLDAPAFEKGPSREALTEHLKAMIQPLSPKGKQVILAIGPGESLLRHAELPQVAVSDMRLMLKHNAKNYLQQELSDYVFDCFLLPPRTTASGGPEAAKGNQAKFRVLVGGAKKQLIDDLQNATRDAGFLPCRVVPSLIGPANAFEIAQPEVFSKEVVALVDVGFKNSTITILLNGELMLSRVVAIGGDRLTNGLAETMGISYAEAEGIKIGMPEEVQTTMQPLLSSLGRELRASVDFFEHQQDKAVSQAFISGGSSRSEYILQALQAELMVPCKSWNPTNGLQLSLPPKQMSEIEQVAPQLAVAVGAAASAM
jgi:type IV pilus assembly protein PilM